MHAGARQGNDVENRGRHVDLAEFFMGGGVVVRTVELRARRSIKLTDLLANLGHRLDAMLFVHQA